MFLFPIIFIRPEYRDDPGLLAHEEAHVEQAWEYALPVLWALHYTLSKSFRLYCEVQAYKAQLRVNALVGFRSGKDYTDTYAGFISDDYGLSVSKEEAKRLLLSTV